MNEYEQLLKNPLQRRAFLTRMSAAGLGLAAANVLAGCGGGNNDGGVPFPSATPSGTATPGGTPNGTPNPTATGGGLDRANFPNIVGRNINEVVLNFALSLEILEADLYRQALNVASGLPIGAPLKSDGNYQLRLPAGALNANSGQAAQDGFKFLRDFTFVEAAHRDFLRVALRSFGAPVQPPNPGGYRFPGGPGGDLKTILGNILPIEETGVRAYLGAAGFLTDLGLLQTAATIFSTEARHSAVIEDAVGNDPGPIPMPGDQKVTPNYPSPNTFEYFLEPRVVLQKASAYFGKASGTTA